MQTVSASLMAFVLSLRPHPTFAGEGIYLAVNPATPYGAVVQRIELVEDTSPHQPLLIVHTANAGVFEIHKHQHFRYEFCLSSDHHLLKELPNTPFNTDLHLPHALTLAQTHTLLTNALHNLQIPSDTLKAWPHPLTLTFLPQWPTQRHTEKPTRHPFLLHTHHSIAPTGASTSSPEFVPSHSFTTPCTLEYPFHTPPLCRSQPLFLPCAADILLDILLPYIPSCWVLVQQDYHEPSLDQPDLVTISTIPSLYAHPSMQHSYASSPYAMLFVPNPNSPPIPLNTPIDQDILKTTCLLQCSDLFRFPADQPTQPTTFYLQQALLLLQASANTAIQQSMLC